MNTKLEREIVTVAVISYNSSNTILETLNSILAQTYGSEYIELIISDDASKDNSVEVLETWLANHNDKFHSIKLLANHINGGVSKNCNVAWKNATSQWIKTIAGDDLLAVDCIKYYMDFIQKKPSTDIVFSYMSHFIDGNILNVVRITPFSDVRSFFDLPALQQHSFLLTDSFNIAPTSFIKRSVLSDVDYCNEEYRSIEDLPLWLKLTSHGYRLSFMDKITVHYRISDSLSNSVNRLVNLDFINQVYLMHRQEIWPHFGILEYWRVIDKKIEHLSWIIPSRLFKNRKHMLSMSLHYIISCFRPLAIRNILKRFMRGVG